ncbi:MAG: beta-lactamase family protein [Clostridia bacterium]|nr:beta-lactamase family protein [Clostridia bacterium]
MYIDFMKRTSYLIILLCFVIAFSSCNLVKNKKNTQEAFDNETTLTVTTTEKESATEKTLPLLNETPEFEPLKTEVDNICNNYGATAVQAAVIKGGKLYCTYEFGTAQKEPLKAVIPDTKFRIASLSKLVTDIVFMRLCEEGLADLNGDISTYLGFTVRNPHYPEKIITPAMLMSHMSSIIDSSQFLNSRLNGSDTAIETLLSSNSSYSYSEPGANYSYSNFSVALIGCICEKITNESFEKLADKYVFTPLDIDAGYTASDLKNPELLAALYGSGGYTIEQQMAESFHSQLGQTHHLVQGNLTISAKDYINIAAVLCNDGLSADGIRLLKKSSTDKILNDSVGFGHVKNSYVIENKTLCTHTGSNFGMFSAFAIDPETGNGVVVLTSGASGTKNNSANIYDICLDVIQKLFPVA